MAHYYLDKYPLAKANTRLMHVVGCRHMANKVVALGDHVHCHYALEHAREWCQDSQGCPQCVPLCSSDRIEQETRNLRAVLDQVV